MNNKECAVYIIESTSGHFKIGRSNHPNRRLGELKVTKGPYEYELIYSFWFQNEGEARYIEGELHKIYADNRVNGEWFTLATKDLLELGSGIALLSRLYSGGVKHR